MALGPLKAKKIASEAPPPHLTASKPSGAKTMCRKKLRNEVPAARNLALSCHPRLLFPCSLLPHTKTCGRPRRGAVTRDLDHGDLICLLKGTNMLLDCGTRADWTTTMTPGAVKGGPACAPILTAEAHASRANLGWRGVSQRTKFRSSELYRVALAGQSQRRFARSTDAGTQQRTRRISRLAAELDMQSESSFALRTNLVPRPVG